MNLPKRNKKTNRPYLSWSQIKLYRESKSGYIDRYFKDSKERWETQEMRFGTMCGEALETRMFYHLRHERNADGSNLSDLLQSIPECDIYEKMYVINFGEFDVIGYADGWTDGMIHEYKTGKYDKKTGDPAWTQEKVDEHGQLDIYALAEYKLTGIIPDATLYWIETQDEEGTSGKRRRIQATGKLHTFYRQVTLAEVEKMEQDIIQTAKDISEFHTNWGLCPDIDITKVKRVEQCRKMKDEWEQKYKEAIEDLKPQMELLPTFEGNKGKLYWTERKKYEGYSNIVQELEDEIKAQQAELKKLKTKEEKKLTPIVNRTLVYKISK